MVWLLLIASVLGFLAVMPLLTQPSLHDWMMPNASNLSLWHSMSVVSGGLLLALLLIGFLAKRHFLIPSKTAVLSNSALPNHQGFMPSVLRRLGYVLLTFVTLMGSVSSGIYQQLRYQQSLLTVPVTVTATVSVKQISDTITTQFGTGEQGKLVGNGYVRHIWQITQVADGFQLPLPMNVMVTANVNDHPEWLPLLNQLSPNSQASVKLALRPITQPKPQALPSNVEVVDMGFDEALWLQSKQVQATAQLLTIEKHSLSSASQFSIEQLRWQLRQKVVRHLSQTLLAHDSSDSRQANDAINSHAILLGLLTGDKALMSRDIKQLYQMTGISHLLAISGPHVLMLASVVSLLLVALIKRFVPSVLQRLPSRLIMLWVSVAVAGFYALLVGFELPAQRTFWMLVWLTLASQWLIASHPYRVLAWVALLMLWLDPLAVRQAGFWLSFVAVALLIDFSAKQTDNTDIVTLWQSDDNANPMARSQLLLTYFVRQLWALFQLQLRLFVLMLPVVIWFFGKVSLIGVLVNLIAVPLLGLIIVPLNMLAGVVSGLPLIGEPLSDGLWSLLTGVLTLFHHGLLALVKAGLAKQWFMALSHPQLLLCGAMVLIVLGRGVLSRLLLLPLGGMVLALSLANEQKTATLPTLTVMDNSNIGISLLVQGDNAWLILAEQKLTKTEGTSETAKPKISFGKTQKSQPPLPVSNEQNLDPIRQLLAHSHVTHLTGVISQTPSPTIHQLVQNLAQDIPIEQYWLAGFDPLHPNDPLTQTVANATLTPSACQVGKGWQQDGLTVKAVSGWQLDLPLTNLERQASQTCLIEISHQPNGTANARPFQALISAGSSAIPMQMSGKLCQVSNVDLLIQPYQTPIDKAWLDLTLPKQLHLINGQQDYQNLSETANIALLGFAREHSVSVLDSQTLGTVRYQLQPPFTSNTP